MFTQINPFNPPNDPEPPGKLHESQILVKLGYRTLVECLFHVLGTVLTLPHAVLTILPIPGFISLDHQQPLAELKMPP